MNTTDEQTNHLFLLNSQYANYAKTYIKDNYQVKLFEMEIDGTYDDFILDAATIGSTEHFELVVVNNQNTSEKHNSTAQETMNLMTKEIAFQKIKEFIDNQLK